MPTSGCFDVCHEITGAKSTFELIRLLVIHSQSSNARFQQNDFSQDMAVYLKLSVGFGCSPAPAKKGEIGA
jgi:hypothetical protein